MYIKCAAKPGGGFPYLCLRGTSSQEGLHRHIERLLPQRASEAAADQLMLTLAHMWNIKKASTVRGEPHPVTYDLDLVEAANASAVAVGCKPLKPQWRAMKQLSEFDSKEARFGPPLSPTRTNDSALHNGPLACDKLRARVSLATSCVCLRRLSTRGSMISSQHDLAAA